MIKKNFLKIAGTKSYTSKIKHLLSISERWQFPSVTEVFDIYLQFLTPNNNLQYNEFFNIILYNLVIL